MSDYTGLNPLFTQKSIALRTGAFVVAQNVRILRTLQFVGEWFVNEIRRYRTYQDQTGNLRSSLGYVIALEGNIIKENFSGVVSTKEEGLEQARKVARQLSAQKRRAGYVLIVFAGMEYAASVESKGYDVLTGSIPGAEKLLRELTRKLTLEVS